MFGDRYTVSDSKGFSYVADSYNNCIEKFDLDGRRLSGNSC
jgi:hypothetical protein